MDKEQIVRKSRVEFAEKLGLQMGDVNYESIVNGPPICTFVRMGLVRSTQLNDAQEETIKELEKDGDRKIIHVIANTMNVGSERMNMDAYIYQSLYEDDESDEEWYGGIYCEKLGEKDFAVATYVENLTYPECSEYGDIAIQNVGGFLIRTA